MVKNKFLTLNPGCILKLLEKPSLYKIETDELFELNQLGFKFLKACSSSQGKRIKSIKSGKDSFIKFCLKEKILSFASRSKPGRFFLKKAPSPSLRYLLLHITDICNLKCKHCYLGAPRNKSLRLKAIKKIFEEFEKLQGLRLLVSGGEPLLHPEFWKINRLLPKYKFRKILLTNGMFLNKKNVSKLNFDEVQVSLDGLKTGHEFLRGQNTFFKALKAIKVLKKAGRDVSISTMVHSKNLKDFKKLSKLLRKLRVSGWTVDIPYSLGRLKNNPDLTLSPKIGSQYLKFSYGPQGHPPHGHYACGVHLMAVMPDGRVDKCGYFLNSQSPKIKKGLKKCFLKIKKIKLKELKKCRGCQFILDCRGGCRARAGSPLDKDQFMCYFNYGGEGL